MSEEDRVLIKVLIVEKGYGVKRIMNEFTQLGNFARASLPLPDQCREPFERTTKLRNGATLITASLIQLSIGGGSNC